MLLHYFVKYHNTENVILQQEIIKENCIKYITASSKWTRVVICALNLLIWSVIQQCMYETIQDVDDLGKRLMQTWFDFDGHYRRYD